MHIFISYSKKDTRPLAIELRDALNALQGVTAWMDESLVPMQSWAMQIQDELDRCDYMVVLLSPDVNRRPSDGQARSFVLNEIDYAQQMGKPIIPVKAEDTKIPVQLAGIQYINFARDKQMGMKKFVGLIAQLMQPDDARLVTAEVPAVSASDTDEFTAVETEPEALEPVPEVAPIESPPPVFDKRVAVATDKPAVQVNKTVTKTPPVQSAPTRDKPKNQPQGNPMRGLMAGAVLLAVVVIGVLVAITTQPPPTPTIGYPDTDPVTENNQWRVVSRNFDGVEMVLVPKGCFIMGTDDSAAEYFESLHVESQRIKIEQPTHDICFDSPFWIDRYEVSNQQYGSTGYFSGDDLPRETVSWDEARNHCEARDARLPTEPEWEYATRGPDNLYFPWGNEFDHSKLNYCDAGCSQDWADTSVDDGHAGVASVTAYPQGQSWVGAYNLSGNVFEWVSSGHFGYPYDPDDGRESDDLSEYIQRGGSFDDDINMLRATSRFPQTHSDAHFDDGFRCARDYTGE